MIRVQSRSMMMEMARRQAGKKNQHLRTTRRQEEGCREEKRGEQGIRRSCCSGVGRATDACTAVFQRFNKGY